MIMLIKVCHSCSQHRFPLILPSLACKTPESSKTHAVCTHQEQATSLNMYQVQSHALLLQEVHLLTANCATHFMKSDASWNQCGLSHSNQYPADHESDDLSCPCHAMSICDRGTWATGVLILWVITWSCLAVLNSHAQNHFIIYFTPWSQTVRGLWKAGAVNHSESDLGTWAGWLCPQSSLAVLPELTFLLGC